MLYLVHSLIKLITLFLSQLYSTTKPNRLNICFQPQNRLCCTSLEHYKICIISSKVMGICGRVDFAYWWRCTGKSLRLQPAQQVFIFRSGNNLILSRNHTHHKTRLKKSRIRETKHLSTDADSSTDAKGGWTKAKSAKKKLFFARRF